MPSRLVRTSASGPALIAAVVTALVLLGLATAPAARAHDVLAGSSPASGETSDASPRQVTPTFDDDLLDSTRAVVVEDADGQPVSEGFPVSDGQTATFALPALGGGDHTVTWSVISSDGHRIGGEYGFSVATVAAPPGDTATEPAGDAGGEPLLPAWLMLLLSVGALGGIVAVAVRYWRSNGR